VRSFDFPRLELAILAAVLLAAQWLLLDRAQPFTWVLAAATLACLMYQTWWILPYTPLFPKEVETAAPDGGDTFTIVCANVLTPNRNATGLLDMVRMEQPDVLIAVETDRWWEEQLDALEAEGWRHALKCPLDNLYGMHVYSRLPLEDAAIQFLVEDDIPSAHAAVVLRSGRRLRLHCLHPKPPSPTENPESGERDAELVMVGKSVADAELPVVVAGDLNDVAWSTTTRLFRKVSGLLDPRVGRGMFNTFHAKIPFARWPLDHLFHSRDFTVARIRRLPAFGSDHFPIVVQLVLAPGRNEAEAGLEADAEDHELAREKMSEEDVSPAEVHEPGES
jgi:endonuclease/exonuclease/phosphatase (EEP) superfamily protein YafD